MPFETPEPPPWVWDAVARLPSSCRGVVTGARERLERSEGRYYSVFLLSVLTGHGNSPVRPPESLEFRVEKEDLRPVGSEVELCLCYPHALTRHYGPGGVETHVVVDGHWRIRPTAMPKEKT